VRTVKKVGIYGAGGVAREVAWLMGDFVAFIDDAPKVSELRGKPVLSFNQFASLHQDASVLIAVGNPRVRERLAAKCKAAGLSFATYVQSDLKVDTSVTVGEGSILYHGSTFTVDIQIGQHVQINPGCTVGHDVRIADYTILAPGVSVGGNVQIGKGVWVGTGATIINGTPEQPLTVGAGTVIGAGACVVGSLESNCLYVGVPAVLKKRYATEL
jgi:sugar O-acyltransferase (sialic acid O-acetyltransferase NeuD family)